MSGSKHKSKVRWALIVVVVLMISMLAYSVVACGDAVGSGEAVPGSDSPIPIEGDGGIGDTPIPVEPDGGIGDTPIPVEPDGGIGDTPAS